MTNKPMLSVKKFIHEVTYEGGEMVEVDKLPELCGSELYVLDSDYQSLHEQLELLRALLDKPVFESQYAGMNQQQAQAVSDGVDEILHGKPAAQHHGEPVAWRYHDELGVSSWFDGAPDQISIDFVASRGGCIELSFSKAVEQPAPVVVVMPERCSYRGDGGQQAYNDALDDVARLNGVKA